MKTVLHFVATKGTTSPQWPCGWPHTNAHKCVCVCVSVSHPVTQPTLKYYANCGARRGLVELCLTCARYKLWCSSRETVGLVNRAEWTKSISLWLWLCSCIFLFCFVSFFFHFIFLHLVEFFFMFFFFVTDYTSPDIPGRVAVSRTELVHTRANRNDRRVE